MSMWSTFATAIETELREGNELTGVSGLTHRVDAICVDDKRSRLVVASAEPNPRVAALMQVDLQASMPRTKVIVARPIAVDFPSVARRIAEQLGTATLDINAMSAQLKEVSERPGENVAVTEAYSTLLAPIFSSFTHLNLPPLNQILAAVQQAALLDWSSMGEMLQGKAENLVIPLAGLLTIDSMQIDRSHGICPLPLYEFTEADWELFLSGARPDDVRNRLKELDIFQYFFPAADQVALGLVERTRGTAADIAKVLSLGPRVGHPFGERELTEAEKISDMIDELQSKGLVVEGEMGLEVTPTGASTRATIKFRPREGFVSKLMQRFNLSVNVSPGDFIP